jgi:hypothetical protein
MLTHDQIVKGLQHITDNASFAVNGLDIQWLDEEQEQPTMAQIEAGWAAYQIKVQAEKAEAEAKRLALLQKLGITEEEAKLLLS